MIGKLKGKLDYLDSDHLIIDVGGVGYIVFCSHRTLRDMPEIGGDTTLIIETHVREDHIHLFGFIDSLERDCFRQLIKVKGVGSKLALAILGVLTPNALSTALNLYR
jgi:Holliday junction DNA helicase RuvA